MPTIIRYGDPSLKIRPLSKPRPPRQQYGRVGNMPSDEPKSAGESRKPKPPLSDLATMILAAIAELPMMKWIASKYEEAQQQGVLTLTPADDVTAPMPPRQQYARGGESMRYESAIDVAKYQRLTAAGRTYGNGRTMEHVAAGPESRMQYQRHQQSIKADCEAARKLALREGLSYAEALDRLGVVSVPLPS